MNIMHGFVVAFFPLNILFMDFVVQKDVHVPMQFLSIVDGMNEYFVIFVFNRFVKCCLVKVPILILVVAIVHGFFPQVLVFLIMNM
jgi:hypothetical protein